MMDRLRESKWVYILCSIALALLFWMYVRVTVDPTDTQTIRNVRVVQTGTPLDCSVSSELLKNLFWNKAPLHDGAVIVRDGRIVGAGCMLPLSSNVNLSRDLGMRHRAGIGMSENSDAVVVIVSEETGSISAAVGGMLKRHLAPETLERLLRNELLSDEEKERRKGGPLPKLSQLFGGDRKEGDGQ